MFVSSARLCNCAIFTKLAHSLIMCNYCAIVPRTAEDFFPFVVQLPFSPRCLQKELHSKALKSCSLIPIEQMKLNLEAENVKLPDYTYPFTSCYKTLYQQEKLIKLARTMEDLATQIRHRFQVFAYSGFPLPTSTVLRKAVVSTKKDKLMFSTAQLSRVVQMIMENKPYLLFRPKNDLKTTSFLFFLN